MQKLKGVELTFNAPVHPNAAFHRGTLWHIHKHFSVGHEIHETLFLENTVLTEEQRALSSRIATAYHAMRDFEARNMRPEHLPNAGIWEMVKHEFHGEFYRLMATRDTDGFARYMNNAMRESITYGLGPSHLVFDAYNAPGEGQNANVLLTLDRLASLAEAVAALPNESPEQGGYGANVALSATELVNRIEATIGAPIGRPAVMGNFGILVNDAIIDVRVPDDVYTAYRIQNLRHLLGTRAVCEIGAGLGGTAIQAVRMGCEKYTLVDIPVVSAIQAWFIGSTLGPEAIRLYGEQKQDFRVDLVPYWKFGDLQFDLAVNRDSMPEIEESHVRSYLRDIAAKRSHFLSINHEAGAEATQLWVHKLIAESGLMRCVARHRAWTREGYVEELYGPVAKAA